MMDAKGVRNMYSIPVVVNKHNTARVASCWFIIYYREYVVRRLTQGRDFSLFQSVPIDSGIHIASGVSLMLLSDFSKYSVYDRKISPNEIYRMFIYIYICL